MSVIFPSRSETLICQMAVSVASALWVGLYIVAGWAGRTASFPLVAAGVLAGLGVGWFILGPLISIGVPRLVDGFQERREDWGL